MKIFKIPKAEQYKNNTVEPDSDELARIQQIISEEVLIYGEFSMNLNSYPEYWEVKL